MTPPESSERPRWGIFGGSFDPPHRAHAGLIAMAIEQLKLDRLLVVPTGFSWHKVRNLSPAPQRLAMAELAFAGIGNVAVDGRETRRTGPSYTIDTLQEIQGEHPGVDWFLLMGEDQAVKLSTWHRWQELVQSATICVAERDVKIVGSDQFVLPLALQARFVKLKMPLNEVSATFIRAKVARHEDVAALVGEPVARYIAQHRLYLTDDASKSIRTNLQPN